MSIPIELTWVCAKSVDYSQSYFTHTEPGQLSLYSHRLQAGWLRNRVRFLAGVGGFSLIIQISSEVHPASYQIRTEGSFPTGKTVQA
jgi:hypothetical protein